MKKQEYAIVDIETTGGNASGSRITEIAIIIHDGKKIVERWETLVNPQKEIPPAIFALTGITNEMVGTAPIFDLICDKVLELLKDRVFVAHNVNFDYSFIRNELELAGFKWTARKLCTVRAARKIKPGLPSYSLGRLCNSLDIPLENAHRAGGDANTTAILFSRLLEWDDAKVIETMIKKTATDQRLPPHLPPNDFDALPEKIGVYYFYDQFKKVIYVGKAVNIKKRVASHFSGHKTTAQRQNFLRDVYGISFEVCATELIALLLECTEIKKLWPIYNRALKRFEFNYGLYEYESRSGYRYLAVGKLSKGQSCIESFNNLHTAINALMQLKEQFTIDYRFCNFGIPELPQAIKNELEILPDVDSHNELIENALNHLVSKRESFAIIDKGRTQEEKSVVYVENGHFYGMGYLSSDIIINEITELKEHVLRYSSNQYIMQLITAFADKYTYKVLSISQSLKKQSIKVNF
ncbi:exonuclease domain-containing protein [Flavobacterium aquatile]|uniref:DNA polymerase III subunit epsilon n=1 Tax=Flavobacterium aquatile LMG 4008 = ATCC 11947 TaxID=1453498 RepID=A0A095SX96_9FLAO|nr:exonuclease domain-containing protein [Flavobacterium aquatile]KGD69326.1 DNA polymerase III subunit epsilon [Flavobacterium aquatile LMG 4008 = ATCC 11947]OXA66222.1 DNA polymerase III subunit epsilon [Flavobacterium aquatile LMG 4008 = ATCC 11947]GEC77716.1 exonuclease [Flavobacterium aquatile]